MPPIPGIETSPVQPSSASGHGNHDANGASQNGGPSFATALAQAMNQAPGGNTHGDHGSGAGTNSASPTHSGAYHAPTKVPNGGTDPRHFAIGESEHGGDHAIQETVLGLRAYRQQLIASNIANADTPGYKAVDIDFQEALRIARSAANTPPLALSTVAAGHISGQAQSGAPPYQLKYHIPLQPSADGNTVELDVERAKFAENSVMWEFSRDRVSSHFKMTLEMLQSLKD